MDGEAWQATIHVVTSVGHDLETKAKALVGLPSSSRTCHLVSSWDHDFGLNLTLWDHSDYPQ